VREREAELEQAGASGCWATRAESREGGRSFALFFLFQSIFFKWIFEFSFEFESTTQYKNPMQQHECTFM
jgi:hypothetical protein